MTARLFQGIILQMKETVPRQIGVLDSAGTVISCTQLSEIGETRKNVVSELGYTNGVVRQGGYTYRTIANKGMRFEHVAFVEGEDELAESVCGVLSVAISNVKSLYGEKYDKSTFIKNIILDNILSGDIFMKSRELHFSNEVPRVVLLVRQTELPDVDCADVIRGMFPDKQKDFVISVNETDTVLVKEVKASSDTKEFIKMAKSMESTLSSELGVRPVIGIGSTAQNLKDLARSFKEAQVAIEVGLVFDTERSIISYDNLGVGRLIYQLPTTLCEMFLSEVFRKGSIDSLDQETLFTIQKFFENNLNVSETSRKLFVHRNTLVYRLEKIKKITGLDLREFDHAIVFKVALMVKKYLVSCEKG